MESNKLTPSSINEHRFVIPLYQRLFEWEEAQVEQLLEDLYASFKKDKDAPYYIGVLTVYKDNTLNRYALVDGQQRFTVLILMGIVLGWSDFLMDGERLSFFARPKDSEYLKSLCSKGENKERAYINHKMQEAIACMEKFLASKCDGFKNYIKEKTTFFLSKLPDTYTSIQLNYYFEAMNEAGKGLENHEILKVRLLQQCDEQAKSKCTKIWNLVYEMDKPLISQSDKETSEQFKLRVLDTCKTQEKREVLLKELKKDEENTKDIASIEASEKKPQSHNKERSRTAILDFQEFLLLVLALTLKDEISFEKNKLLETFRKLNKEHLERFFDNLLKYRLLFDYFVIYRTSQDSRDLTYGLDFSDGQDRACLIKYQAMLYVSTSFHLWLVPLMKHLENFEKLEELTSEAFLQDLKDGDNERHKEERPTLEYKEISRYWFWRLDYYLWEKRSDYFKDSAQNVAGAYEFRPNRSIEHIAPQKPKTNSTVQLDNLLHKFGNLAMISSSQNSSLKNESYEVKRAHVQAFINKSVHGSIESLKLLKAFSADTWDEGALKTHHNEMIDVLKTSFPEGAFQGIKDKLEGLKL